MGRPSASTLFPYPTLFRSLRRTAARARETGAAWLCGDGGLWHVGARERGHEDRKSTRLNSSHITISYAVFCLKKKTAPAKSNGSFFPPVPLKLSSGKSIRA